MLLFPIAWYIILYFFGQTLDGAVINDPKAFEQIYRYQFLNPFTDAAYDETTTGTDPLFLWNTLGTNFRYWDFTFYAILLFGLGRKLVTGLPKWEPHGYRLSLVAICIWFPLAVYFPFVPAVREGAFSPVIPLLAVTVMTGIWWLSERYFRVIGLLFCLFWIFNMFYTYLGPDTTTVRLQPDNAKTRLIENQRERLTHGNRIYQLGRLPAKSVLLQLHFANPNIVYGKVDSILAPTSSDLTVFMAREEWETGQKYLGDFTIVDEDEHYLILEKN
jgi:hypothetical protein